MFNDFIDAHGPDTLGWVNDPNGEMMGGYAGVKCWLA
jgi:peptide/nickel transport system substrate-binding protein